MPCPPRFSVRVTQSHDDHAIKSINLKENIKKVNNLTKLLYRGKSIHITKKLAGDLCFLNSALGLSTCSSSNPCCLCLVTLKILGNFEIGCTSRTPVMQRGMSHAVEGAFCAKCNKHVSKKMVVEAQNMTEAEITAHRQSHFCT